MGGNDVPGVEGGGYGDHVLLAPAFIATRAEIDQIIAALELALRDVMSTEDVQTAMAMAMPAATATAGAS